MSNIQEKSEKFLEDMIKSLNKKVPLKKDIWEQNNNSKVEYDPNLQTIFENENLSTLIETQKSINKKK